MPADQKRIYNQAIASEMPPSRAMAMARRSGGLGSSMLSSRFKGTGNMLVGHNGMSGIASKFGTPPPFVDPDNKHRSDCGPHLG